MNNFLTNLIKKISIEFFNAPNSQDRLAVLSLILSFVPIKNVHQFIPELSESIYHRSRSINRLQENEKVIRRKRYTLKQYIILFNFLHLLISLLIYHIRQAIMQLSNGNTIEMANIIKKHINANIIRLYNLTLITKLTNVYFNLVAYFRQYSIKII